MARWHNDYEYRRVVVRSWMDLLNMTRLPWRIIHTSQQDLKEFIQNTKHWVLRLNQDGAQQPLNQRHEFKRLHDEYVTRTQQKYITIPHDQQVRQHSRQSFEGIDEYDCRIDLRTGWRFSEESRGDLPTALSSSTNWDRNNWKTGSWNSKHSSWSDDS